MPTHSDRSSGCARRQQRRPDFTHPPFVADEIHYLSSHPHFSWFCESAFLVDGYEPVSLLGTPALALRAHIPDRLANLELVNSIEDLDHIGVEFVTLPEASGRAPALWRCNVSWKHPHQPIYAVAGYLDDALLAELLDASMLLPIRAQIWERWELTDAHLVIDNEQDMWKSWQP